MLSHRLFRGCAGALSTRILLTLALLLMIQFDDNLVVACPSDVCICKWKGGKQTVECGGQQLATIPEGMDPGTQVLNFSGNSLQVLQSERFLRMDLLNLQKIFISRNQLIRIHEKAFRGLSNLVELDLSDNSLQHVPSETFQDYPSLMRLSLSGNPIREVKVSAFRHLSFLTTLELSNCQVERIENEAFIGMDNLEWLRLDGNRISFIQGSHILPKSLHGISLQSNRWTCDCRLIDVHAWLVNYNTPETEEPKCVEPPRLKGQVIKSLKRDELACLPEVTPKSTYKEISEGRNISIMCVVRAIPEPRVLWLFNGQVMTNDSLLDNLHMFYYIDESGAEEKRSEIFIYNVGPEDNGTFSCVGQNIAGTTFSNYTLRVIIKEPPVVNEVSFPQDYMNYIIASSSGATVIFIVLLCTIVVKCKQKKPEKRKGAHGKGGSSDPGNTSDTGLMKCSSIINADGCDNLGGGGGGRGSVGVTPTKMAKENGVIIGGQMKQNLMMYASAHMQSTVQPTSTGAPHHLMDNGSMQLIAGGPLMGTPPPHMMAGKQGLGGSSNGIAYCSPPSSVRNYQEKNPDLVNDAESVKNKLKMVNSGGGCSGDGGGDSEYDGSSDCSGPCSIQGMQQQHQMQPYDSCYQIATNQFGSQIIRPSGQSAPLATARFTAMSTLPRGMQLKAAMASVGGGVGVAGTNQHQVDVHLNPVCFLGQDGFAYDFSNNNPLQAHHHLHHLHAQQQQQQQPQQFQQLNAGLHSNQQQNFYRTLPHNRAHKQHQFAASAANPGTRYSLEAEFLQRSGTPSYDKYLPNVRFTAEGYPMHAVPTIVQYPSPPDGYKADTTEYMMAGDSINHSASAEQQSAATICGGTSFQQWPPCLPGYHVQPIRYPPSLIGMPQQQQQPQQSIVSSSPIQQSTSQSQSQQQPPLPPPPVTSSHTQTNNNTSTTGSSGATATAEVKKRCVGAQTTASSADNTTIPEGDEMTNGTATTATAGTVDEETSKLRHLTGPLADSPDEGYVGDSQEGSDI